MIDAAPTDASRWLIRADWPAPASVRALVTTRNGPGVSGPPFAHLNLGDRVGDQPLAVARNRELLHATLRLPAEPLWMHQVHGIAVSDDQSRLSASSAVAQPVADAAITGQAKLVLAVLTADCLPLFLTADDGSEVALVHAGWRGLAAGVIEACVQRMHTRPSALLAWLGPAIGPMAFEVGADVRDAMCAADPAAEAAFQHRVQTPGTPPKWLCDLYLLARMRLRRLGVHAISGGGLCTHSEAARFYSHRRDGRSGRMASLIWRDPD